MWRCRFLILLVVLGPTVCGCTPELTRSDAERKIAAHEGLKEWAIQIPMHSDALRKSADEGFLLTSGKIDSIAGSTTNLIELKTAVSTKVTATGISDVPGTTNQKEVQFTWTYVDLPSKVKRFAADGGTGISIFRLFDDGWRIERIKTSPSDKPIALSEEEKREDEADLATEQEKRRVEAQKQRVLAQIAEEARRQESDRLAKRVLESKTYTKTIAEVKFSHTFLMVGGPPIAGEQDITLSDVTITFKEHIYGRTKPTPFTIWFGYITGMSTTSDIRVTSRPEDGWLYVETDRDRWDHQSTIFEIPFQNAAQRDDFLKKFSAALQQWRNRFNGLPPFAFQ